MARNGARVLVMNAMGRRVHGSAGRSICRWSIASLAACPLGEQADAIIVDFHAEASQREAGVWGTTSTARVPRWWVGTHTHVADR